MDQSQNRITAYRKIRAEATNLMVNSVIGEGAKHRLTEIIEVATMLADSEYSGNFEEAARRCDAGLLSR